MACPKVLFYSACNLLIVNCKCFKNHFHNFSNSFLIPNSRDVKVNEGKFLFCPR